MLWWSPWVRDHMLAGDRITCPSNEEVLDQEEGGTAAQSGPFVYPPCSQVAALSRFLLAGNTDTGVGKVRDEGSLIQHSKPYAPASQCLWPSQVPPSLSCQNEARGGDSGIQTNILFIELHMNFPLVREVDWQCVRYHRNLTDWE